MRRQCELLGVNRPGLYYQPVGESEENLMLMRLLDEEYCSETEVIFNWISMRFGPGLTLVRTGAVIDNEGAVTFTP